jgi:unsaturated rhamnogalacturonyl hydrolase
MKASVVLFLVVLCLFSYNSIVPGYEKGRSPEEIGRLVSGELISRPEFMMYAIPECTAVHYAEACAGFGAARLAGLLKDKDMMDKLTVRYRRVIDEKLVNTANHVDANVYGILPLEIFLQTGYEQFFKQGIELADIQWDDPLPDGMTRQTRYWIDDIWMITSLQVQAYRATGKMEYLERAALEVDAYIQKLQQPCGLFFHGLSAHFYWGRGNGWVAAGMAELLTVLPLINPHYSNILAGYHKMMKTLAENQADDGMWRQLVDHEESFKETSCTAMFGYAITVGVKKGLLPDVPYKEVSRKAWDALITYIGNDGKISNVCVGTGQSTDLNFYLTRPTVAGDLHGQAPVLWFAYSLLADY